MDIGTLFGLIIGLFLVAFGMMDDTGSIPETFFNIKAMAVVLGGTFAATVINYPLSQILGIIRVSGQAFSRSRFNPLTVIDELVSYNKIVRDKGLMELENHMENVENKFMRNGLEMAQIEKDGKKLEIFLRNELTNMIIRHRNGQEMFYNMGSYAPAFGLLGTVMGLILMMTSQMGGSASADFATQTQNMMASLLSGMGRALVTTFYGVLLANLLFVPIAGKLKTRSDDEVFINEIIISGILSIHSKEHPLIMEEKLLTFVSKQEKDLRKNRNGQQ
jgi:chemotaxis protein MotA